MTFKNYLYEKSSLTSLNINHKQIKTIYKNMNFKGTNYQRLLSDAKFDKVTNKANVIDRLGKYYTKWDEGPVIIGIESNNSITLVVDIGSYEFIILKINEEGTLINSWEENNIKSAMKHIEKYEVLYHAINGSK